ncbi:MAG: hypothetical protein QW247_10715 [Pyrobaculum sp.]
MSIQLTRDWKTIAFLVGAGGVIVAMFILAVTTAVKPRAPQQAAAPPQSACAECQTRLEMCISIYNELLKSKSAGNMPYIAEGGRFLVNVLEDKSQVMVRVKNLSNETYAKVYAYVFFYDTRGKLMSPSYCTVGPMFPNDTSSCAVTRYGSIGQVVVLPSSS